MHHDNLMISGTKWQCLDLYGLDSSAIWKSLALLREKGRMKPLMSDLMAREGYNVFMAE